MRVFVSGATGVIGRRAIPRMLAAGHQVTAAGRSPSRLAVLEAAGARTISLDLFDRQAVERALAGHDTVVNLATHIPRSSTGMMLPWAWRENDRVRRVGARILADAALAAGAARFVQESFAPIYPDSGDRWIDERAPVQPGAYNRTTIDAEHSAAYFGASGAAVVLRFGALYGPDHLMRDMLRMVRRGLAPLPGSPDAYFSPVSQEDAAGAVVEALDVAPGIYNVVDDEPLPRSELFGLLARAVGAPEPRFLPPWARTFMGSLGDVMGRSQRISNAKLRGASQWVLKYRSVRDGWPAVVDALRLQGVV